MMKKVSVIGGGGNVGASAGLYLAERGIAEVLLVDIVEGVPQGKGLDLLEAGPIRGYDSKVAGTSRIEDIAGSDVVLVTAGFPRKPGMSRTDLLNKNAEIVGGIAQSIKAHAPQAFVVVVSNPLDIMTYHMRKVTGFPAHRVLGMAGVLDSARFRAFIAQAMGVAMTDVQAMVLGGHGDSMVPLPCYSGERSAHHRPSTGRPRATRGRTRTWWRSWRCSRPEAFYALARARSRWWRRSPRRPALPRPPTAGSTA
jgi:malate dehydrogenase